MRKFIFIILLFLITGIVRADGGLAIKDGKIIKIDSIINPTISFIKPNQIKNGLMLVRANLKDAQSDYIDSISYDWKVFQDGEEAIYIPSRDDNTIIIGGDSSAKQINIKLTLKAVYKLDDGSKYTFNISGDTQINNGVNPPNPNPPNPNPGPPLRVHAQFFKDLLWSSLSASQGLDRNLILGSAKQQAANYRNIASKIGQDGYVNAKDILGSVKKLNNNTINAYGIPDLLTFWNQFGDKQADYLWALYQNSKTEGLNYKDMFVQIAEGLEAVQ